MTNCFKYFITRNAGHLDDIKSGKHFSVGLPYLMRLNSGRSRSLFLSIGSRVGRAVALVKTCYPLLASLKLGFATTLMVGDVGGRVVCPK